MKKKKKLLYLLIIVVVITFVFFVTITSKSLLTLKRQIKEIRLKDRDSQEQSFVDPNGDKELSQDFTLLVLSDPPGAKVYPLGNPEISDSIGVTPLEMKGSYHIDRDGSGWGSSGQGIYLEPTEDAYLIYFNCIVVKDGYGISEVNPVLATIPKKDALSNQLPSKLKYNAKLISKEPNQTRTVGTAIMVNGSILHVNPPSLKTKDSVYMIDIKSAE